jgi:predicted SnoaL-like aldol condensation-catalyzing enzyme
MDETRARASLSRRTAVGGIGAAGIVALLGVAGAGAVSVQEGTPCPDGDVAANKELVLQFYDAFYEARNTGEFDRIDEFVAEDYIQHEAGVEPGREGLKNLLRSMSARGPATAPMVAHLVGEGDLVIAHQVVPGSDPDGPPAAEGVDIFRIENGQLVEHWGFDVSYESPADSAAAGTPTG